MSALDNMKKRLDYYGGANQQDRMIKDKERSLKGALKYSYQAVTMIIENYQYDDAIEEGINTLPYLEFRCLMNPDKLNKDADLMMLSVPYNDICLNLPKDPEHPKTSEGIVRNPVMVGDTFEWKGTDTRWIICWRYIDEAAYLRADTRKCFPFPLQINEHEYWFAVVGPNQLTTDWNKHNSNIFNTLNYTKAIYIKRNDETLEFFKRHQKIKVPDIQGELKPWTIVAVESNLTDDVIIATLKEGFTDNTEEVEEAVTFDKEMDHIVNNDIIMYAYDTFRYTVPFVEGAYWDIQNVIGDLEFNLDAIKDEDKNITTVRITLLNGKTGEFDFMYNNSKVGHIVVKPI